MSTTASPHAPAARLERPREGRMIAGVSAGIARHLNVDPTLVRLGFIVAAIAGGFGFAAYLAAFLLIPEEGAERAPIHAFGTAKAATIAGVVLLVLGAIALVDSIDGHGIADDIVWASVLAGAGGFLLLRRGGDTAPVSPTRRSRVATRTVAGCLLLLAAAISALTAADVNLGWQELTGIAIAAAGVTLVAGSFFGASPWLVVGPLTIAAAAASLGAAGAAFDGPIGDRSFRPARASELPRAYEVAIGSLVVDLRDTEFPEGTTRVKVRVGIGEAKVELPADVGARIIGHAGAGEVRLPGGHSDGTDVDRDETIAAPGRPQVLLDVSAGLGEVRVEREGS